jgi:hypothetical protein
MTDYSKKTVSQLKIAISNLNHKKTTSEELIKHHGKTLLEIEVDLKRAQKMLEEKEEIAKNRQVEKKLRMEFAVREAELKYEYLKKRNERALEAALRWQSRPSSAFGQTMSVGEQPSNMMDQ